MSLVYGGMNAGLMGIVAENALASGAHVTGIVPQKIDDSKRILKGLNETILVQDLWERKLKMFNRADAIVVLPGGFGTIDEMFEALHWQNVTPHNKPIILINTENYWNDLIAYINTVNDLPQNILHIVENETEAIALAKDIVDTRHHKEFNALPHFEDEILEETNASMVFENANTAETYKLATALGLKQLGKHNRHMGMLNDESQFTHLIKWVQRANEEHFITDHCIELFSVADSMAELDKLMSEQKKIVIDLDREKWGPSETGRHLEINERPDKSDH